MKITLKDGYNITTLKEIYIDLLNAGFNLISGLGSLDGRHISLSVAERIFLSNNKPTLGQARVNLQKRTYDQSLEHNSLVRYFNDVREAYFKFIENSQTNRVGPKKLKIPENFIEYHLNTFCGIAPLPEVNSVIIEIEERGELILFSDRLIALIIRLSEVIVACKYFYDNYDREEDIDELDKNKLTIVLINGWDILFETFSGISVRNMKLMRMTLPEYKGEDLCLYLNEEEKRLSEAIAKVVLLFILGHEYAHIISCKKNIEIGERYIESEMDAVSLAMLLINPYIDIYDNYDRLEIIDAGITLSIGIGCFLDMYYGTRDFEHPNFLDRLVEIQGTLGSLVSPDDIKILQNSKLSYIVYAILSIQAFTISQLQANHFARDLFSGRGIEDFVRYGRGFFTRGHGDIFE